MCEELDAVQLNFSEQGLLILDMTLFIIMFGVALNLKIDDFVAVVRKPRSPLVGLISQFLLLPALTLVLILIIKPCASIALGMFMVAACPGGNISNFMALLAKGNVALSVSLSAIATLLSIVMTPFNFVFWSGFYAPAANILQEIAMDPISIFLKILMILAIPLALGMWTAQKFPNFTSKVIGPIRTLSIVIFGGYIVAALSINFEFFLTYVPVIIGYVFVHNLVALSTGYGFAWINRLDEADRRSITIETGIQNSGIALVLIFGPIFNGLGGMALIAALWGIWHIVAGLSLAGIWTRIPISSNLKQVNKVNNA